MKLLKDNLICYYIFIYLHFFSSSLQFSVAPVATPGGMVWEGGVATTFKPTVLEY